MPSLRTVFALVALSAPPALLIAQSQQPGADTCSVRQSSDAVVLMACAPDAGPQKWRAAATQACGSRSACNVWIWDDVALVPAKAPATDAELPKDRTGKAVAIWVHESQNLVTLKRTAAGR